MVALVPIHRDETQRRVTATFDDERKDWMIAAAMLMFCLPWFSFVFAWIPFLARTTLLFFDDRSFPDPWPLYWGCYWLTMAILAVFSARIVWLVHRRNRVSIR